MKRTPIKRKGKSVTSKLQAKCDKLLSPIIKYMSPVCLLNGSLGNDKCTYDTQVAHHHIKKSTSSRLRYEIDNLVPLCNHCHAMLHHNETYWSSVLVKINGVDWFKDLELKKQESIKVNKAYYEEQLERLQGFPKD